MFARNLLPVEFTDLTPRPLRLALELGGTPVGARVTLLSVLDDSFPNPDVLSRSGSLGRTTPAPARRGEVQDGKAQAEVGEGERSRSALCAAMPCKPPSPSLRRSVATSS